jgi:hypothetical protein
LVFGIGAGDVGLGFWRTAWLNSFFPPPVPSLELSIEGHKIFAPGDPDPLWTANGRLLP